MYCHACGQQTTPGAGFCAWCGVALAESPGAPPPTYKTYRPKPHVATAATTTTPQWAQPQAPERVQSQAPTSWQPRPRPPRQAPARWQSQPQSQPLAQAQQTATAYSSPQPQPQPRYADPSAGVYQPQPAHAPPTPMHTMVPPSGHAPSYGYAYPPAYAPAPQIINNITVTTSAPVPAPQQPVVVLAQRGGVPLLLRALYFLMVGLWLGAVWTVVAWLLMVTILGLPLGLWMLNRLPQVVTLKPVETRTQVVVSNGVVLVSYGSPLQRPFLLRALYFLTVGWWASGLWLLAAWGFATLTLCLCLPLSFWMFNRAPTVVTLAR